jgi:DNA invertase Pin-like site-specific DNA recombinase
MTTSLKFIAYRRVSTKEQGDSRNGLEAQQHQIEEFVKRVGGELLADFEEVASAKHWLESRTKLDEALKLCQKRGAVLIVAKLDRLSRVVENVGWMVNSGKQFVTVDDGLNAPAMQLYFKAIFAEEERKKISERTSAALQAKKRRGEAVGFATHSTTSIKESARKAGSVGGAATKAYADSFALKIEPVIKRMRACGMTVNEIARELNEQGNKTARGGQWHAKTISRIIVRLDGGLKRMGKRQQKTTPSVSMA